MKKLVVDRETEKMVIAAVEKARLVAVIRVFKDLDTQKGLEREAMS